MKRQFSDHEREFIAEGAQAISGLLGLIAGRGRKMVLPVCADPVGAAGLVGSKLFGQPASAVDYHLLMDGRPEEFVGNVESTYRWLRTCSKTARRSQLPRLEQILAMLAAAASIVDARLQRSFPQAVVRGLEIRLAFAKLRDLCCESLATVHLRTEAPESPAVVPPPVSQDLLKSVGAANSLREAATEPQMPEHFKSMIEQISEYGIFMLDPNGGVKSWNRGAEGLLGFAGEATLGRGFASFYRAEEQRAGKPEHALRRAAQYGRFDDTVTQQRSDGSLFLAKMTLTGLRDDGGKLLGYVETLRDVTDEQRVTETLRCSEEKFRAFFEHHTDPAAINRLSDGAYLEVNQALLKLYGFSRDEIIGRTPTEIAAWCDAQDLQQFLATVARAGSVHNFEVHTRTKDRSVIPVLLSSSVAVSGGEPVILSIVHDLSERKRLADELARARDAAREAARSKALFLANVSHEIRTPLNVVLGCADEIADQLEAAGSGALSPLVTSVRRAAERLLSTVTAILDLARIESHRFELYPRPLRPAQLLRARLGEYIARGSAKRVAVQARIQEPEAVVEFDELCLVGAIDNLVSNAVKFTEAGGEISLGLYRDPAGTLCLEVCDTGIGIAKEYLPHLFESFSQESTGSARRYQGAGLGLALAKRYLEMNGATLTATSEKGRGSVFTIVFGSAPRPAHGNTTRSRNANPLQ
jgi:PAS domain S-box-containing protein